MALAIRRDRTVVVLRKWARQAGDPRAASRAFAIANALEGMSRAEAARLAGMERQALRDAVLRYNAEGVDGLSDRPRVRRSRLTEGEQAALRALILRGPDPERDGVSSWTRADIADLIERHFGHRYHVSSLSKILRALGFSRQKTRPSHPNTDPKAQAAWLKKAAARGSRRRGQRPIGPVDQRHGFAYMFATVEPASGKAFCLVLPEVSTLAMNLFLDRFGETVPDDVHVLMVVDGAGWHTSHDLVAPDNVTLFRLPPYAPELNPVERVWLHVRERHLSHRVMETYTAIVDALCQAWCQLTPQRLKSLCGYPWIRQVIG